MKVNPEIRSLLKSFSYAFRGVWFCIQNERNMRIHLTTAVWVILFSMVFGLTRLECGLLILTLALVIFAEMVNTALEALVDLQTAAYDNLARIAKDVAAAAVLVTAFAAVGIGVVLFGKPVRLWQTICLIGATPVFCIIAVSLLILGLLFIFNGPKLIRREKTKRFNGEEPVKIYRPKK